MTCSKRSALLSPQRGVDSVVRQIASKTNWQDHTEFMHSLSPATNELARGEYGAHLLRRSTSVL